MPNDIIQVIPVNQHGEQTNCFLHAAGTSVMFPSEEQILRSYPPHAGAMFLVKHWSWTYGGTIPHLKEKRVYGA